MTAPTETDVRLLGELLAADIPGLARRVAFKTRAESYDILRDYCTDLHGRVCAELELPRGALNFQPLRATT